MRALYLWVICLLLLLMRMLFTIWYAEPKEIDLDKVIFDPFLFAKVEDFGLWNYIYHGAERLGWVLFVFTMFKITDSEVLKWFFALKFVDMADYFLNCNTAYFFYEGIPMSFNLIIFVLWSIFGLSLLWKVAKRHI